jgi:hypothetical protein
MQRQGFKNHYFLYDTSRQRIESWFKAVNGYNFLLYTYESEMSQLIKHVKQLIDKEKGRETATD